MSSPRKVKVVWGKHRLVIPCGKSEDKISRLLADAGMRFRTQIGFVDPDNYFVQLKTIDGFQIHPNDVISEVISDGDILTVIDKVTWIRETEQYCKQPWLRVIQSDFEEDTIRWALIGPVKNRNALYVEIGVGRMDIVENIKQLEIFDREALNTFPKDGRQLICRFEERKNDNPNMNWFAEVYFVVSEGIVVAAQLAVKSFSDPQPKIKQLEIKNIPSLANAMGEIKKIQSAWTDPSSNQEKHTFPDSVYKGERLPEDLPQVQEKTATDHGTSTGDSIQVEQIGTVQVDQTHFQNGCFYNVFCTDLRCNNLEGHSLGILEMLSEYQDKEGNWRKAELTRIGRGGMSSMEEHTNFSIAEKSVVNVTVETRIKIEEPQRERKRWIHKSLPRPLKLRITLKDQDRKTSVLIVTAENDPSFYWPRTVEERRESKKKDNYELLFGTRCDDVNAEDGVTVDLYWNAKDKEFLLVPSEGDTQFILRKSTLRRWAFKAVKEGQSEFNVHSVADNQNPPTYSINVFALVDLETTEVYGLKFHLKTLTNETIDFFPITTTKIHEMKTPKSSM